jgi:hypothetical protein
MQSSSFLKFLKFKMRGNAVDRGMKGVWYLPCAGITQIRFDGFDLSPDFIGTPRETLKFCPKISEDFFEKM